jgi:hypothetical protein
LVTGACTFRHGPGRWRVAGPSLVLPLGLAVGEVNHAAALEPQGAQLGGEHRDRVGVATLGRDGQGGGQGGALGVAIGARRAGRGFQVRQVDLPQRGTIGIGRVRKCLVF